MRTESLIGVLSQFPDEDGFWDFDNLENTERNLSVLLDEGKAEWSTKDLELLTQKARLQSLQLKLPEAGATLNRARELISKDGKKTHDEAELRFLIEKGRFYALSMDHGQSFTHLSRAWELAQKKGDEFHSVELAFLFSISQPPKYKNEWLQKAIALAESSKDSQVRKWLSILYVMDGWHLFDLRKFEDAMTQFEKALSLPQDPQDVTRTRGTKWAVARTLRALNRIEESLKMQKEILEEIGEAGVKNGYVFLEIAECLQLLKKHDEAKAQFEFAYKELSLNGWYSDNKGLELSRIQLLAKKK